MGVKAEYHLQRLADLIFAHRRQPRPNPSKFARARIIAHRGEHDNCGTLENTIPAFAGAQKAGVWGIELDVRWTGDQVPVILHDADLKRLHGVDLKLDAIPFDHLKARCPAVPSLAEVVADFGGRMHLMIELKEHLADGDGVRRRRLARALAPLSAVRDYHLMSLDAVILDQLQPFPRRARVAIAYYWPGALSRRAAAAPWGGLCAHYLLMPSHLIRKHHRLGQCVGTGYTASRNCLFRELNRGVDWIFSNHAARMQAIVDEGRG